MHAAGIRKIVLVGKIRAGTLTPIWSSVTSPDFLATAARHKSQIGSGQRSLRGGASPTNSRTGRGSTHRRVAARRRRLEGREEVAASPWLVRGGREEFADLGEQTARWVLCVISGAQCGSTASRRIAGVSGCSAVWVRLGLLEVCSV